MTRPTLTATTALSAAIALVAMTSTRAAADGPSPRVAEKDIRARLDPKWVAAAKTVTLAQVGDTRVKEGYLHERDVKTTTF